jgi:hypothetical protein
VFACGATFGVTAFPGAVAAGLAGLIIMSAGVVALAYRSPHIAAKSSAPTLKNQRPDVI